MNDYLLTKILSTDGLDQNGIKAIRDAGIEVVEQKLSKSDLIKELPNFDAIIIRSATTIDAEIINAVTNNKNNKLKVIARAGTGVDNIDMNCATEKGLLVINTPAANTISAAEHTVALMCSLSRQIPQAHTSMKNGKWERKLFMGNELMDKTLAIIGLGKIGKEVAIRAQAFGMKTIGFDPIIDKDEAKSFNVDWMELNEIWPLADYITVHVPLIPQTENLIDLKTFEKCKFGVKIINCARGGIVNENDLLKALNSKLCGGAALDVFVNEPPTCNDLINHPNLIATPHLGASTVEGQYRVSMEIAENLISISTGKSFQGSVNGNNLDLSKMKEIQTWKVLLKGLSSIVRNNENIGLFYNNQIDFCSNRAFENFLKSYLSMEILLLKHENNLAINLINSINLAKQFNIKISLEKTKGINSCPIPRLSLKLEEQLIELSLINEKIYLTKYNDILINQPFLLEDLSHFLVVVDAAKSKQILTELIEKDNLINYYHQQDNSIYFIAAKTINENYLKESILSLKI